MAFNSFDGSVLLVSHDRALLREVCDEFWLVAQAKLQPFDGDLDDYQRWLADQQKARAAERLAQAASQGSARASAGAGTNASASDAADPSPGNKREDRKAMAAARQALAQRTRPIKQELQRIEARLAAVESEREAIQARIVQGSADSSMNGAQMAEAGRTLRALEDETEALEARWLELGEELQAIEQEQPA